MHLKNFAIIAAAALALFGCLEALDENLFVPFYFHEQPASLAL